MADIITAIAEVLKADAGVSAWIGARAFGVELDPDETASMPRAAIVVQPSGGVSLTAGTYLGHDSQRLDVLSYGATPFEANEVGRAAYKALKTFRRGVVAGVLIHWVDEAGGYSAARDRDGKWPTCFQSFQAFYAET